MQVIQMGNLFRKWLGWLWLLLLVVLLAAGLVMFQRGNLCAYLGTDFRGYYASAQIALKHGFSSVYDQKLQNSTQDALAIHCPNSAPEPPLLHVSVPYLPIFVLLFLPLTAFEFTKSTLIFSMLSVVILATYLVRFSKALGVRSDSLRMLEWMVCLPVLANLSLGQINVFLVVCLGEFILAYNKKKQALSGWWLAGLLIKPHVLILLLPGLVVSRRWKVLYGFGAGLMVVIGGSILLAGIEGVAASVDMAVRFAGPLIQTGPAMMNWRALALNLEVFLPGWMAWTTAGVGMAVVAVISLHKWPQGNEETGINFIVLILATLCATFTISWHSHFYMMMLLIPILLVLDQQDKLPPGFLAAWVIGPPGVYLTFSFVQQDLARNAIGLGYFGLNLFFWGWAIQHSAVDTASPIHNVSG